MISLGGLTGSTEPPYLEEAEITENSGRERAAPAARGRIVPNLIMMIVAFGVLLTGLTLFQFRSLRPVGSTIAIASTYCLMEWLPVDAFGYLAVNVYDLLGVNPRDLEPLIPSLAVGSVVALTLRLLLDAMGMLKGAVSAGLAEIWRVVRETGVPKATTMLVLVYLFSRFNPLAIPCVINSPLLEYLRRYLELVLGTALVAAAIIAYAIRARLERSRSRTVAKFPWSMLIVPPLATGLLSILPVSPSGATLLLTLMGGLGPSLALRLTYVMMIPSIVQRGARSPVLATTVLPPGYGVLEGLLLIYVTIVVGLIVISALLAFARRVGTAEVCFFFGSVLLLSFLVTQRIEIISLLRRLIPIGLR